MRDIKFKFWYKEDKEIYYPENIEHINFEDKLISTEENGLFGFDEIELLQYIGLKDKNDKEIYEGDIIEISNQLHGIIMFNQEMSYFGIKYIETVGCNYIKQLGNWISCYKIIGNIYDNPELIEQAKSC